MAVVYVQGLFYLTCRMEFVMGIETDVWRNDSSYCSKIRVYFPKGSYSLSELDPLLTPAQLPALTPSLVSGIRSFGQGLPHSIWHKLWQSSIPGGNRRKSPKFLPFQAKTKLGVLKSFACELCRPKKAEHLPPQTDSCNKVAKQNQAGWQRLPVSWDRQSPDPEA